GTTNLPKQAGVSTYLALTFGTLLSSQGTDASFVLTLSGFPPGASLRYFVFPTLSDSFASDFLGAFSISEVVLSAELVPFGGQPAPLCMPQTPVTPHRRRAVSPCCAGRRWSMSVLPWHGLVGVRPRRLRLGRRLIQY
ncbi:hypothetical protein ACFWCQ_35630, partial [Streptomyces cyaneofuscatus]|uniref:hypothetical protein n=1 Tax=Streptomyces cyaneofuscatus TaxID=66883 RepID=UPI0036466D8E